MTGLDQLLPADEPGPDVLTGRQRARRRRARACAVAFAVLVAVAGGWWVTHPQALEPVGSAVSLPVEVGDSAVVTMFAHPTSGEVRLLGAAPVITENSADARIRVLRCGNPSREPASTIVGAVLGRAEQVCATTGPARAPRLGRVRAEDPYLVLEVTPRAPGTVTVEGLRVRYRTGAQQGKQDSGLVVRVSSLSG